MNARRLLAGIGLMVVLSCAVRAQDSAPDVRTYINEVTAGNVDEAKKELPSLQEKYPDDPGVMYLEALLTTDASSAVRIYQNIVDNHAKCEWADASLYKVYQFYYSLGLYKTADLKMAQLQKDYPDSKYLKGQPGIVQTVPPPADRDTFAAAPVSTPASSPMGTTAPANSTENTERASVQPKPPTNVPASTPAKEPALRTPGAGSYTLQLGAFGNQTNADRLRRAVEALGYRVEVVPRPHGDKMMYHVWIGTYATEGEARAAAAELRTKHAMDAILVSR